MNCEQVRQELLEQFGEHGYSEAVTKHLQGCVSCKEFAEELGDLTRMAGGNEDFFPEPSVTQELIEGVERRLDNLRSTRVTPVRSAWHSYIPAVAALLVVIGFSATAYMLNVFNSSNHRVDTGSKDTLLVVTGSSAADEEFSTGEVDSLLNDFAADRNETASEYLIDDLSADELEYLENNLKAGDIL